MAGGVEAEAKAGSRRPEERIAGRSIGRMARMLAIAGGGLLLSIAGLVTISVILRGATGEGITGDFEIVQLAAAVAAFCLFPLCVAVRGNIFVDTFTGFLPVRANAVLDAVWDVLFGIIMAIIAWRMMVGAVEQRTTGTTLQMLNVSTWGAVAACAALMGVLALTALAVGWRALRGAA